MKTLLFRSLAAATMALAPASAVMAQDARLQVAYSAEELDNLVAPVALYPDPLLAQLLVAATFPDQVEVAARYVRERGTRDIDDQPWDISVKAVAHYPPVLNMLYNQDDWATALGQAYAAQSGEVMDAVQRMRDMAREQGNLVTTAEQRVEYDRERIVIVPANPRVIYVPTYDPYVVYYRPVFQMGFHAGSFSFGIGFPIGSWLVYDMDWYGRRVYYDGWYGGGWRTYARPYVHLSPVYVHPRYRSVNININIFNRRVNYVNLDRRYRYVHRTTSWERHDRDWNRAGDRDRDGRSDGRGDDRNRGSVYDATRDFIDRKRDNTPNDRIGNRAATFNDYRPDRAGSGPDVRDAEPRQAPSFGTIEKRGNGQPSRGRVDVGGYGSARPQPETRTEPRTRAPVFSSGSKPSPQRVEGSYGRSSGRIETSKAPKSGGASVRSSPSSGGGGGSARSSSMRPSSSGKVKGGGGQGGGKGRKQ